MNSATKSFIADQEQFHVTKTCALVQKQSDQKHQTLIMSIQFKSTSLCTNTRKNKSLIFFKTQPYSLWDFFGKWNEKRFWHSEQLSYEVNLLRKQVLQEEYNLKYTQGGRTDEKLHKTLDVQPSYCNSAKYKLAFHKKIVNKTSFTWFQVHSLQVQPYIPVVSFTVKRDNVLTDDKRISPLSCFTFIEHFLQMQITTLLQVARINVSHDKSMLFEIQILAVRG